jgi:hypothetical protein
VVEVVRQVQAKTYRGVGSGNPKYGGRKDLVQLERPAKVVFLAQDGKMADLEYEDEAEELVMSVPVESLRRVDMPSKAAASLAPLVPTRKRLLSARPRHGCRSDERMRRR